MSGVTQFTTRLNEETLLDADFLNPRMTTKLHADEIVSFIPMSALSAETGSIVDEEARLYSEVATGYTPFQRDDILVAKITPCFENNKIGQAKLTRQWGFGSTEFHVVRARPAKADPRYLLHFLRQDHIRAEGERRMTGSVGHRRVPEHFLAGLEMRLPSLSEQRRIASILDQVLQQQANHRVALDHLGELLAVLRHRAFNGEL